MRDPQLLTVLFLLAFPTPSTAQETPTRPAEGRLDPAVLARIEERGQELVDGLVERGSPGASAALVLPDGSRLTMVAGVDSLEDGRPLTAADRMLSGSVGKTYVTALAHFLIHAGKLDLDATAASYFEGVDAEWLERLPNAREVTLRQLLRHQSGIPRWVFQPAFERDLADPDRTFTPEQCLAYVYDMDPLFAPGEGWSYADTNYLVVGMVIERVTGETFYDQAREHLIEPLGLVDTVPSDQREIPGIVQGHVVLLESMAGGDRTLEKGRFVFNPQFEWCGGGWASTPLDLARWARLLYGGLALGAEEGGAYLETLLDAVDAPGLGRGTRYGLGAMLRDTPAGLCVYHDGIMPGYLTSMGWFPESGIAGALQVNTDDARALGRPLGMLLVQLASIAREELAR